MTPRTNNRIQGKKRVRKPKPIEVIKFKGTLFDCGAWISDISGGIVIKIFRPIDVKEAKRLLKWLQSAVDYLEHGK